MTPRRRVICWRSTGGIEATWTTWQLDRDAELRDDFAVMGGVQHYLLRTSLGDLDAFATALRERFAAELEGD